jgi:hypothetical protein
VFGTDEPADEGRRVRAEERAQEALRARSSLEEEQHVPVGFGCCNHLVDGSECRSSITLRVFDQRLREGAVQLRPRSAVAGPRGEYVTSSHGVVAQERELDRGHCNFNAVRGGFEIECALRS